MEDKLRSREARREAIKQRRKARTKKNITIGCGIIVLLLMIFIIVIGVMTARVSHNTRVMDAEKAPAVSVEIPEGSSVKEIAAILEKNEIIDSATRFSLYCRLKGAGGDFKAGHHYFTKEMTYGQVVDELNNSEGGGKGAIKIRVPEGSSIDQIAEIVAKATGRPSSEFINAVKNPELVKKLVEAYPDLLTETSKKENVRYTLEGYLFPATYDYNLKDSFDSLITQMVNKTAEVVKPLEGDIKASGHSLHEIMTMASYVEKEGNTSDDRKKIASTFFNRLKQDMMIQSDISVLYALGVHKELVTYKDLETDSPYNLYKHKGLGPGPVNNPSQDAIEASVRPAATDYLYFFADLKTGKVFFTNSFDEHLKWQEEYKATGTVKG